MGELSRTVVGVDGAENDRCSSNEAEVRRRVVERSSGEFGSRSDGASWWGKRRDVDRERGLEKSIVERAVDGSRHGGRW